jgi:hypothetical protein
MNESDKIKKSQELKTITEDDRSLLLSRLANYSASPDSAIDWTELREETYGRYAERT